MRAVDEGLPGVARQLVPAVGPGSGRFERYWLAATGRTHDGAWQPAFSECRKSGRGWNIESTLPTGPEVFRLPKLIGVRLGYGYCLPGLDSSRIRRFLLSSVTANRWRISRPML